MVTPSLTLLTTSRCCFESMQMWSENTPGRCGCNSFFLPEKRVFWFFADSVKCLSSIDVKTAADEHPALPLCCSATHNKMSLPFCQVRLFFDMNPHQRRAGRPAGQGQPNGCGCAGNRGDLTQPFLITVHRSLAKVRRILGPKVPPQRPLGRHLRTVKTITTAIHSQTLRPAGEGGGNRRRGRKERREEKGGREEKGWEGGGQRERK